MITTYGVNLPQQILGGKIQEIAKRYHEGDSTLYLMAASSFRIPYWDWATDSNLPPATTWPEITVNAPDGEQTIPNPLYSFTWPSLPLDHDPAWFPTTDDPGLWNSTGTQRDLNPSGNLILVVESLREKVVSKLRLDSLLVDKRSHDTENCV